MSLCKYSDSVSDLSYVVKVLNYLEILHIRIFVLIKFLLDLLPIHRVINNTEIIWRLVRRDRIREIVVPIQSSVDKVSWLVYWAYQCAEAAYDVTCSSAVWSISSYGNNVESISEDIRFAERVFSLSRFRLKSASILTFSKSPRRPWRC